MPTLFISDLHLDESRPRITALFQRFLEERAPGADALYILGDLFESWVGDDEDTPLADSVRRWLGALRIPVFFMAGNRDFLIGSSFARSTGIRLLEDPTRVDLYGVPTLLMHGDTLCTGDQEYQQWRTMVRAPEWQERFLALPLEERRRVADEVRGISREKVAEKPEVIMDVSPEAVTRAFRTHGVSRLIHGHTHRMDIHHVQVDGRPCERIVLGDWHAEGSMLSVGAAGYRLESLAPR